MMQQATQSPNVLNALIYNMKGTIQETSHISVEVIDM